jgi:hypothetical protein
MECSRRSHNGGTHCAVQADCYTGGWGWVNVTILGSAGGQVSPHCMAEQDVRIGGVKAVFGSFLRQLWGRSIGGSGRKRNGNVTRTWARVRFKVLDLRPRVAQILFLCELPQDGAKSWRTAVPQKAVVDRPWRPNCVFFFTNAPIHPSA